MVVSASEKGKTRLRVIPRGFLVEVQIKVRRYQELRGARAQVVEVQKKSYDWFLKNGLRELFDEISPISDFGGRNLELSFKDYYLDEQ